MSEELPKKFDEEVTKVTAMATRFTIKLDCERQKYITILDEFREVYQQCAAVVLDGIRDDCLDKVRKGAERLMRRAVDLEIHLFGDSSCCEELYDYLFPNGDFEDDVGPPKEPKPGLKKTRSAET